MAGALGADGITALRGLEDQLQLKARQTVLIFGASGGIGHLAVQLAKRKRATVVGELSGFAVSGDGTRLAYRNGAALKVKASDAKDEDDDFPDDERPTGYDSDDEYDDEDDEEFDDFDDE